MPPTGGIRCGAAAFIKRFAQPDPARRPGESHMKDCCAILSSPSPLAGEGRDEGEAQLCASHKVFFCTIPLTLTLSRKGRGEHNEERKFHMR